MSVVVVDNIIIRVGVVGGGFVGTATSGWECDDVDVTIFDVDVNKCRPVGTKPTLSQIAFSDIVFIAVPTPPKSSDAYSNVAAACNTDIVESVVKSLCLENPRASIIIRSTVPPKTTDKLSKQYPDAQIGMMPEFLTERNWFNDFKSCTLWVLGSSHPQQHHCIQQILSKAKRAGKIESDTMSIVTTTEAEAIKYGRNCFLATKISFFNELHEMYSSLDDVDVNKVFQLIAADPRIGTSHTQVPGPDGQKGFGGSCLPKDLNGLLAWWSSSSSPSPSQSPSSASSSSSSNNDNKSYLLQAVLLRNHHDRGQIHN